MEPKIKLTNLHRNNLKNIRRQTGVRTDVLSLSINKGSSYISQIECGRIKYITKEDLQIIADALHCPLNTILDSNNDNCEFECTKDYDELLSENIALKKENEYLKLKLQMIANIMQN
jgi:transcriptional regulator with XRE-family HTH domain